MKNRRRVKSAQQVRDEFRRAGRTFSDFCAQNDFCPSLTSKVLSGIVKGHRGESHRIAVALGLKAQP